MTATPSAEVQRFFSSRGGTKCCWPTMASMPWPKSTVTRLAPSSNATPVLPIPRWSCCRPKTVCSTRHAGAWSAARNISPNRSPKNSSCKLSCRLVRRLTIPNKEECNAHPKSTGRRRFEDRVDVPDRSAAEERHTGAHCRKRRRSLSAPGRRKAGPDFDGRGDAGPEWLSADARHYPGSAVCRCADHHVHQQESGDGPGLGYASGRAWLHHQAGRPGRVASQDRRLGLRL